MNRLLMASLIAGCMAFAPAALAVGKPANPGKDVPGGYGDTGNPYNGQQGCWTIPIWEPGSPVYKNPGDMLVNEMKAQGKTPKQLADEYSEPEPPSTRYFANVGDMIDQQCGADAVTEN